MSNLPIANKKLGQHWLRDKSALQAMVESADVKEGDNVLEIGPGTGFLTDELLARGARVVALEFDHMLAQILTQKYIKNKQIEVVEGDIRAYDLGKLPKNYKIVANIPYYLTANLFRKLIDSKEKPQVASLLVQKEVAERVCAGQGKLSFVAVALQMFYQIDSGDLVPAHLFMPPPKVDSQIIILNQRKELVIDDIESTAFLNLVKAGFAQPRKKLISNLKTGKQGESKDLEQMFIKAGLGLSVRAQELSLEQWRKLYAASL